MGCKGVYIKRTCEYDESSDRLGDAFLKDKPEGVIEVQDDQEINIMIAPLGESVSTYIHLYSLAIGVKPYHWWTCGTWRHSNTGATWQGLFVCEKPLNKAEIEASVDKIVIVKILLTFSNGFSTGCKQSVYCIKEHSECRSMNGNC